MRLAGYNRGDEQASRHYRAIAGIEHVSCAPTTIEDFRDNLLCTGDEIRTRLTGALHEVGGFFGELDRAGIETVPILAARAMPYGVMTAETFDTLMTMLADELRTCGRLDGVLVAPHGATVSELVADVDGHWLQLVRQHVGENCPIIGTLDPHANLSARMVDATDALIAYRTNPHIDQRERGEEAARLMVDTLAGRVRPTQAAALLPLAINIECQLTSGSPCRELYDVAERMRQSPGVLSTSICLGFPYADVPEMGAATIVVTAGDHKRATHLADELGAAIWNSRRAFQPQLVSVDAALDRVAELDRSGQLDRPVCLLDMGDNVGGGSPGDGTILAHALHARPLGDAFVCLFDPQAVSVADQVAIGERVTLSVGGKSDDQHGPPLTDAFTIVAKSAGHFRETRPRHGGLSSFDQGRTVVVRNDMGLTIMLTTLRMAPWSLEQLHHCGVQPTAFRILVAKGVHSPVAAYAEICDHLLRVNTPGVTSADLQHFDFRQRRRPMFPWETEATWAPGSSD